MAVQARLPMFPADESSFGLPLGWFFGRLGCFVVHDHPGKDHDFFLAVDNFQYRAVTGPRHDLGLYEVFWSIAVVVLFLRSTESRGRRASSRRIAVLYAPVRFGLDFLREADAPTAGSRPGHYSSLGAVAIGVSLLFYMRRHGNDPLVEAVKVDTNLPWPPVRKKSLAGARS